MPQHIITAILKMSRFAFCILFLTTLLHLNVSLRMKHSCNSFRKVRQSTKVASSSGDDDMKENSFRLKGFKNFIRSNPETDKFVSRRFHHVEFYTGEATAVSRRFMASLGLDLVAKSDLSTGNEVHASYLTQSNEVRMVFTAPYSCSKENGKVDQKNELGQQQQPGFDSSQSISFIAKHGLGVRAVAIEVDDVHQSFNTLVANGGKPVLSPVRVNDKSGRGFADVAEVSLYGDAVLRLVNIDQFRGKFLPNFEDICQDTTSEMHQTGRFGIERFDHIVGNVWRLGEVADYIKQMTGFHEFAEFVAEDVGTVDSGLNSVVLANNNERVLLPINEPTYGTRRKSQIQTYLEMYQGEGVQHMALFTNDIFSTLQKMQDVAASGIGFTFMAPPSDQYYERLIDRIGSIDPLTPTQLILAKKLGILIDRDDQGMLLQIFTKPIGDRPTVFLEIIQRLGCQDSPSTPQKPGCGGFGKGNFKDLFKSIEDYELTLGINSNDK